MEGLLILFGVSLLIGMVSGSCGRMDNPASYRCAAREELFRAKAIKDNLNIAKNLVIFIGDGMGIPSITAGRIYQGQRQGQTGEENKLFFETFPHIGLSKTYNSDRQVPDSAGTATAIFTGVKANYGTLGVDNRVPYGKQYCKQMKQRNKLKTVIDYALEQGKSVGVVSNARITHATPAATYAHIPYRGWESDTDMKDAVGCENVKDIALQLVEDNPNIQVILGGGRRSFINNTTPDPKTGKVDSHQRMDNRDLTEEWKTDKVQRGKSHQFVQTKGEFDNVDPDTTEYLFGLFSSSHMTYETDRDSSPQGEPSLTEMTSKAIEILKKNKNGFVILVEGARIDHAHHDNEAKRALVELVEFDNAIMKAQSMTGYVDTLTVVTADHSHVFSVAGYPSRGNNILGLVDIVDEEEAPVDNLPYSTLVYANGPEAGRKNLTGVDTTRDRFRFPACIEMPWETHGGEDVSIYAIGPMAHLFHTTHEQHYIAHVLQYAACIGEYQTNLMCDRPIRQDCYYRANSARPSRCSASRVIGHLFITLCVFLRVFF